MTPVEGDMMPDPNLIVKMTKLKSFIKLIGESNSGIMNDHSYNEIGTVRKYIKIHFTGPN